MNKISLILVCLFLFFLVKKRFFDTTDYMSMIENGGVIIDVRSESEFLVGHIEGSLNIPLNNIGGQLDQLDDKNQPIITCCASGVRSGAAKRLLQAKGYKNVVNGGGWSNLESKLNK